jgi:hypothetical protein
LRVTTVLPSTGLRGERATIRTQLVIQFWDLATATPIPDGLRVTAYASAGGRPVYGVRSSGGVYVFHGLPGLHAAEYPMDQGTAAPPGPPREFTITVDDTRDRFLPAVFEVEIRPPAPKLLVRTPVSSHPSSAGPVYLFSAPSRTLPAGTAAIRGDLRLYSATAPRIPAAHALVQVEIAGIVWPGIADVVGRVLVAFPYPLVERLRLGSPPGGHAGAATATTWPLKIRVRYHGHLPAPLADNRDVDPFWTTIPSLKSILDETVQPAVLIRPAAVSPGLPELTNATLTVGRELVLRTTGADDAALWIS